MKKRRVSLSVTIFWLGIFFLYGPMIMLVIYSFNASRMVQVWTGWSTRWYGELFQDAQLMGAVGRSLQIAFYSASTAVVIGMLASVVMVRFQRFRGRTLFSGMITAPLVMPDVIIGLSMLLLFVAMAQSLGWPAQRGMLTIWLAHTTFCVAYSTVVISSRLREMDHSLEEAALDLGATPIKAFFLVTLPVISPAIISAWLLSFTLSLDDVVIASFVTGPGATTLPIEVFSQVKLGVSPKINALATIIIGVVSLVAFTSWYLFRKIDQHNRAAARMAAGH